MDSPGQDQNRTEEAMLVLRQALQEVQELEHKAKSQEHNGEQNGSFETPDDAQEGLPMIARLLQVQMAKLNKIDTFLFDILFSFVKDLEGRLEADAASVSKKIIFSPSSTKGK